MGTNIIYTLFNLILPYISNTPNSFCVCVFFDIALGQLIFLQRYLQFLATHYI